jgi:NAD(P)-dependent dehydrogenase (short-subunit alcohol dehydrogenase family)
MWALQAIGATPSAAYSAAKAGVHALTKNLASRLVISQPDAVSNMAVPTFDKTLAVHMTVNATEPKAPQREGAGPATVAEGLGFALKFVSRTMLGGVR